MGTGQKEYCWNIFFGSAIVVAWTFNTTCYTPDKAVAPAFECREQLNLVSN